MEEQNLIKVSDAQYKQIIEVLQCSDKPATWQPVGNENSGKTGTKEKSEQSSSTTVIPPRSITSTLQTPVINKLSVSNTSSKMQTASSGQKFIVKEAGKANVQKKIMPVQDINTVVVKTMHPNSFMQTSSGGKMKTIVLNNSGPVLGVPANATFKSQMSLLNTNVCPTTKVIDLHPTGIVQNRAATFSVPKTQPLVVTPAPIVVTPGITPQLSTAQPVSMVVPGPFKTYQHPALTLPKAPLSQAKTGPTFQPVDNTGSVTMPLKAFIDLVRPKLGTGKQNVSTGFQIPGAEGQARFVLQKRGPGESYSLVNMPGTNPGKIDCPLPSLSSLTKLTKVTEGSQMECFVLGKKVDSSVISNCANQAIIANASFQGTSNTKTTNSSTSARPIAAPEYTVTTSKVEEKVPVSTNPQYYVKPIPIPVNSVASNIQNVGANVVLSTSKVKVKEKEKTPQVEHVTDESSIPVRGRPKRLSTTTETKPKRGANDHSLMAKKSGSETTILEVNNNIMDILMQIKEDCKKNNMSYPMINVEVTNDVFVNVAAYENEIHGKKEAPILLLENKSTMPCSEDIFVSTFSKQEEKKSINIKKGNKYFSAVPLVVEEHELTAKGPKHMTLSNSNYYGDTLYFSKPKIKKKSLLAPYDVDYPPSESEEEEDEDVEEMEPPAKRKRSMDDRYACYLCHYIDKTMLAILQHFVEEHMEEKMFVCQHCMQSFFTTSALEWHMHMKHTSLFDGDEKEFTVTMKSSSHYKAELELQLPTSEQLFCMREKKFFFPADELYRCKVCSFKSWYKQRMEEHIRFSHNTIKAFKCKYCDRTGTNVMEIRKHQFKRHPLEEEAIEGNPALMHEATLETQKMYSVIAKRGKSSFKVKKDWWTKYGYEKKVLDENGDVNEDENEDENEGEDEGEDDEQESSFVCKKCSYTTSYENEMVLHMRIIHNLTTTITCCHCTRIISTTPEEMIQGWAYCPECMEIICSGPTTYGLPKPKDLSAKENVEENDKLPLIRVYRCQLCRYKSEERSAVNRHLKYKHMTSKPFECPYCEYGSVELGKLNNHMDTTHKGLPKTVVKNESYAKRFEEFKEAHCYKTFEKRKADTNAFVHLENPEDVDGDSIDLFQDIQSSSSVTNMAVNVGSLVGMDETELQDKTLCKKIAADLEAVRQESGHATDIQTLKAEKDTSEDENDYTRIVNMPKTKHKDNVLQQTLHKEGLVQTLYGVKATKKIEKVRRAPLKQWGKLSTPLATVLGRRTELHKQLLDQHHFKCKVCPYRCKDRSSMTRHVKYMHFKAYPHSCPYCTYCNVEKTKVKIHVKASHSNLPTVVQTNQNMINALTDKIKAYYTEKEGNQENKIKVISMQRPKHKVRYLDHDSKKMKLHTLQNGEAPLKKRQRSNGKTAKAKNFEENDDISGLTSVSMKLDYMKKKLEEDKELLGTLTSDKEARRSQSQSSSNAGSEERLAEPSGSMMENEEEFNLLSEDVSEQFAFEELSQDEDDIDNLLDPLDSTEIEMDADV